MTTYLIINLCISAVLIGWLIYVFVRFKLSPPDSLASFLLALQGLLFYVIVGAGIPVGSEIVTELPAKDFQILKADDRVILVTPKKVTEFFDAKTYNIQEYKTVVKTESCNAYGLTIMTEYELK